VDEDLQTVYFLIDAHSIQIIAEDHKYEVVFASDPLDPHYLYFLGFPKSKNDEYVWKYDLQKDTVASGYPKKVSEVFDLSYPGTISKIEAAGWLKLGGVSNDPELYIFGNKHYYTYNIKTEEAGDLHPFKDLAKAPWPKNRFPKHVQV